MELKSLTRTTARKRESKKTKMLRIFQDMNDCLNSFINCISFHFSTLAIIRRLQEMQPIRFNQIKFKLHLSMQLKKNTSNTNYRVAK